MASRYPIYQRIDYCFSPVHIVDGDKDIIVPCGKCDGCLLHAANDWSMRCGMEIEDSPATIFGSLTYNNKYLPKLYPQFDLDHNIVCWYSDHDENIRFDSVKDVKRRDGIVIPYSYNPLLIQNWNNVLRPSINYASKRDIQLWLKLLRKDLENYGFTRIDKRTLFRYFIISEVGPTTLRNHFHFLLFCSSNEIAAYFLESALYKNWKMCDEDRFTPYVHLCDSGARGYVTQYLTSFSDLPRVYKENKEIRPFRLASKSPAIGFIGQSKEKIYEDVSRGVIEYTRPIRRLESNSILEYPKAFTASLFPKCHEFNKISDSRRFLIYGFLFRSVRELGCDFILLCSRLRQILSAQDYLAMCACYRFCNDFVASPMYYYYLLDTYYYKVAMSDLKRFYQSQESCDFGKNPEKIYEYYPNIETLLLSDNLSVGQYLAVYNCLFPLGYDIDMLFGNSKYIIKLKETLKENNKIYRDEVMDIKTNMVKMSKFNEKTGNSPTNV